MLVLFHQLVEVSPDDDFPMFVLTVKVQFENEPELSKYNDQSKHLLAKYK